MNQDGLQSEGNPTRFVQTRGQLVVEKMAEIARILGRQYALNQQEASFAAHSGHVN